MTRSTWVATTDAIRQLPQAVQDWISELETRCDPAGDLRARREAEDRVRELEAALRNDALLESAGCTAVLREIAERCGSEVVSIYNHDSVILIGEDGLPIHSPLANATANVILPAAVVDVFYRRPPHHAMLEDGRDVSFTVEEDQRWRAGETRGENHE